MKFKALAVAAAAAILSVGAAQAAIIGVGPNGALIAPVPGDTISNASPGSNVNFLGFNEKQGHVLTMDLAIDQGGVIAAGTRVDSHMIFVNRADNTNTLLSISNRWTFSNTILGTMSDLNGTARLQPSDGELGLAGVTYNNFSNRGLENPNGTSSNADQFSFSGATLSATFNVTQPGDWMRVVTVNPIPLPAGALLLPMGLGALALMRRKQKKAAA